MHAWVRAGAAVRYDCESRVRIVGRGANACTACTLARQNTWSAASARLRAVRGAARVVSGRRACALCGALWEHACATACILFKSFVRFGGGGRSGARHSVLALADGVPCCHDEGGGLAVTTRRRPCCHDEGGGLAVTTRAAALLSRRERRSKRPGRGSRAGAAAPAREVSNVRIL